jgi:hypothetical protein
LIYKTKNFAIIFIKVICLEKFEKDILTIENITIDCKKRIWETVKSSFIIAPISLLLLIWTIYNLIVATNLDRVFIALIPSPITLIILPASIRQLFISYKDYRTIIQKSFEVTTDKLVHAIDEIKGTPGSSVMSSRARPCTLQFKQFGNFVFCDVTFYHSSKQFKMWYDELFRSSKIGDEFYLVVDNKHNILIVYNKKFFELKK